MGLASREVSGCSVTDDGLTNVLPDGPACTAMPSALQLVAEMKVPGRAWLQFEVQPDNKGGSIIRRTAIFDPAGVPGLAYWYTLWPLHSYVFAGMLQRIAVLPPSAQGG